MCRNSPSQRGESFVARGKKKENTVVDDVPKELANHKKEERCAPACRRQCTLMLLFECITMDHVGKPGLMLSGWDVPRTESVVPSRRLLAPPFRSPLYRDNAIRGAADGRHGTSRPLYSLRSTPTTILLGPATFSASARCFDRPEPPTIAIS